MSSPTAVDGIPVEARPAGRRVRAAARRFGPLLAALLLIKALVLGYGTWVGRTTFLDRDQYRNNYHHFRISGRYQRPPSFDFFELWTVADAQWYLAIAADGYPSRSEFLRPVAPPPIKLIEETAPQSKYSFFPLWPLVIRAAALPGWSLEAAAFLAANALGLVASLLLFALLERHFGRSAAFWSVVLLQASPFALFFSLPYGESLLFFLAVVTCLAVERERWALTALAIGLGVVTRGPGLALAVVPVTVLGREACVARRLDPRRLARLAWLLLAAVPTLLYLAYQYQKTGDPFFFDQATKGWGAAQGLGAPWQNLLANTWGNVEQFAALPWHEFHRSKLDFLAMLVALAALWTGARVLPAHFTSLAAALLAIPLLTKDLMSFNRYVVVVWPLFCVPALLVRDELRRRVLATMTFACLLAQCGNIGRIVNWNWVG